MRPLWALLLVGYSVTGCAGRVQSEGPVLRSHPEGLQVLGGYGSAEVSQAVQRREGASWKLYTSGSLSVETGEGLAVGTVALELTGDDVVTVYRGSWEHDPWDGQLIEPLRAWLTIGEEVVARLEHDD